MGNVRATASLPEASFDPFSPDFARDPYATYTALRKHDQLCYFAGFDVWLASRYDDVTAIAFDKRMVRSLEGLISAEERAELQRRNNWHDMPYHERFIQTNLLESDGPVHQRLRRQVFKFMAPAPIAGLRDMIQAYVDGLIDGLIDRGEIDFVGDLAAHVPGHVIGRLLGVPEEDCPKLRAWSEDIVQYFDINRTEERKQIAETASAEFAEYMIALKADRQRVPQDDLISRLLTAEHSGEFIGDEFIATCMLILKAGHGSTIDVLGSGMHLLLRFPDQMSRLREDPSLINTAVQEMFRYESPLPFFHRYNTEEMEIGGHVFPRGTKFGLLYGSANRDAEAFDNPDVFDVGRKPNRHVAFGGGAHFCLGNHLARLDMDIIFTTLLRRLSSIELVDEAPQYKPGLQARGPKTLRVAFEPA